jgi:hypothetical protein
MEVAKSGHAIQLSQPSQVLNIFGEGQRQLLGSHGLSPPSPRWLLQRKRKSPQRCERQQFDCEFRSCCDLNATPMQHITQQSPKCEPSETNIAASVNATNFATWQGR